MNAPTPYPDDNPKTIYGDKKLPLHLAPMSAVHAMAEAFADGAKKYGPYNWREKTVSSTVYYGAALRHLAAWFDGEELAEDSGVPHLSHALACLAILVDAASIGKLNDNRPLRGASGAIQAAWVNRTPRAYERATDSERVSNAIADSPLFTPGPFQSYYGPSVQDVLETKPNTEGVNQAIDRVAEIGPQAGRSGSSASALTQPRPYQRHAPDRVSSHGPVRDQTSVPPEATGAHDLG